ncbi:hypothetical protein KL86DYS2_10425 [uncultured Dysgonomonas sp.]|uniref:Uncharacterized protein n=1 Tax=uncultured Dysgonomonas sp. TaxID=206096 RepID=A0A212IZX8_9BACT|nr:hypothetical protein KL86DYS2_10425 [uncultured Dysgonomonas sp.]
MCFIVEKRANHKITILSFYNRPERFGNIKLSTFYGFKFFLAQISQHKSLSS